MKKYETIEMGIEKKDLTSLREAIGSICYADRDFSSGEFDEVTAYVESKGIKIKDDSLTGKPIISSQKTEFTDDDFSRAIFELKKNFCDERINDVKTIGKKLYGNVKPVEIKEPNKEKTIVEGGSNPNFNGHQSPEKKGIPVGALVAILGVVAVILIIVVAVIIALIRS